jgi:deoxycytidylate deaminase
VGYYIDNMDEEYFTQAAQVATKATCHRARCGAVIVSSDGIVVGRGFNAPPLGDESQRACGTVYHSDKKPKSDKTCCVHAEWNAILNALRDYPDKVSGATLYFMRIDDDGEFTQAGDPYCTVCSRLALQSGIKTFGLWNNGPQMYDTGLYNLKSYEHFA